MLLVALIGGIYSFWLSLNRSGDESFQFATLVAYMMTHDTYGALMMLLAAGFGGFAAWKVITRTAHDPVKTVLFSVPLVLFFGGLGFLLAKDVGKHAADVRAYTAGEIVEERVVIMDMETYPGYYGDDGYEYSFSDGRTFYENHEGHGFGSIVKGQAYIIRYLPHTPKLLSIRKAD